MLKGRESVVRLVGKRRRFLPNRETLLSASDDLELVTCPVCALKISAQHHAVNSHLDTCLSESETPTGTKRKLSQRTLLDSNFLSKSKIHQSQLTNNDDFCGSRHSNSHIINNVVVVAPKAKAAAAAADVDVTMENVSGVTLQTFIVGRRFFSHENELHVGANISLLPDPHNVKDPNAIKVLSSDSGSCKCKVLGFLPRELAQYLSPLMEKYCLSFEGYVTSVPKNPFDFVPIQIARHKMILHGEKEYEDVEAFKCLWKYAIHVVESTKNCPPESFTSLSNDSQRLFVRLYTRKDFQIKVLTDTSSCHIAAMGYLCLFEDKDKLHDNDIKEILNLLTVSELHDILCKLKKNCNHGRRKSDLLESLLPSFVGGLCPNLTSLVLDKTGACIRISSKAESLIWRAERLFFLNGEQNLSTFLLVDLGIVKYPTYDCIISEQIFPGQDDLLAYEEAIEVAQIMDEALDGNNVELVLRCIKRADSRISSSSMKTMESTTSELVATFYSSFSASWVYSKVVLLGVSFLERERRYNDAINLLKRLLNCFTCDGRRGYWTLRLSINLEHTGYPNESLTVAEDGLQDPWVRAGSRMALQRRILRLGKPPRRWKTPSFSASIKRKITEVHVQGRPLNCEMGMKNRFYGEDGEQCGVEQLALQYYAGEGGGWQGVHTESGIWLTIFGLLMWDIIFSNVPNVFRTRFQVVTFDK
ncbi:fanconi-associated nuclease 1 like protein [Quercus suber]|uniref:Fanconi-associated nuclease n=1 Tax=Quercus suber TaxID=58331 RepID=A0AAW0M732_QUESU